MSRLFLLKDARPVYRSKYATFQYLVAFITTSTLLSATPAIAFTVDRIPVDLKIKCHCETYGTDQVENEEKLWCNFHELSNTNDRKTTLNIVTHRMTENLNVNKRIPKNISVIMDLFYKIRKRRHIFLIKSSNYPAKPQLKNISWMGNDRLGHHRKVQYKPKRRDLQHKLDNRKTHKSLGLDNVSDQETTPNMVISQKIDNLEVSEKRSKNISLPMDYFYKRRKKINIFLIKPSKFPVKQLKNIYWKGNVSFDHGRKLKNKLGQRKKVQYKLKHHRKVQYELKQRRDHQHKLDNRKNNSTAMDAREIGSLSSILRHLKHLHHNLKSKTRAKTSERKLKNRISQSNHPTAGESEKYARPAKSVNLTKKRANGYYQGKVNHLEQRLKHRNAERTDIAVPNQRKTIAKMKLPRSFYFKELMNETKIKVLGTQLRKVKYKKLNLSSVDEPKYAKKPGQASKTNLISNKMSPTVKFQDVRRKGQMGKNTFISTKIPPTDNSKDISRKGQAGKLNFIPTKKTQTDESRDINRKGQTNKTNFILNKRPQTDKSQDKINKGQKDKNNFNSIISPPTNKSVDIDEKGLSALKSFILNNRPQTNKFQDIDRKDQTSNDTSITEEMPFDEPSLAPEHYLDALDVLGLFINCSGANLTEVLLMETETKIKDELSFEEIAILHPRLSPIATIARAIKWFLLGWFFLGILFMSCIVVAFAKVRDIHGYVYVRQKLTEHEAFKNLVSAFSTNDLVKTHSVPELCLKTPSSSCSSLVSLGDVVRDTLSDNPVNDWDELIKFLLGRK